MWIKSGACTWSLFLVRWIWRMRIESDTCALSLAHAHWLCACACSIEYNNHHSFFTLNPFWTIIIIIDMCPFNFVTICYNNNHHPNLEVLDMLWVNHSSLDGVHLDMFSITYLSIIIIINVPFWSKHTTIGGHRSERSIRKIVQTDYH